MPKNKGLLVSVRIVATAKTQYGKRVVASRHLVTSGGESVATYLYEMGIALKEMPIPANVFKELGTMVHDANRIQIPGGDNEN